MSKNEYPKTPELDKLKACHERSQIIGEFLSEFLPGKGLELCHFREACDNGEPQYVWKKGITKCRQHKRPTAGREPDAIDRYNGDAEHNPEHESWSAGYLSCRISVEKLLAQFFDIDLDKVEKERCAVLAYIRKENAKESAQ